MKNFLILFSLVFALPGCKAQLTSNSASSSSPKTKNTSPKIVVGITVDQMRYDYLIRFWDDFGDGGFKRLVNEGFTFRNHNFSYAPTFTGPGHASIFTGTTPAVHGIIANDWWERESNAMVYCANDNEVNAVGTDPESYSGHMSPKRLRSSTIGDELKLFSNDHSKVVGISMKDRGAILPAGHQPNGAFWFEGKDEGKWISSTWYGEELPQWVQDFNALKKAEEYLGMNWDLLLDESAYNESTLDNTPYEAPFRGTLRPVFPYNLQELRAQNGNFDLIKATPHGNSISVDFALASIDGEQLGDDEYTDLLALSFSSTDYVGHQFGPHARETQDTYLRLDRELKRLLNGLDEKIGMGNYLVFLSADHGGAPVPSYVNSKGWHNNYFTSAPLINDLDSLVSVKYGPGLILNYSNEQIFLDNKRLDKLGIDRDEIEQFIAHQALNYPGVVGAYTSTQIITGFFGSGPVSRIQAGYRPNMSGNVCLLLEPGWMEYGMTGTTHGMPYSYDTHVPFILYGTGIKAGESYKPTAIKDIAPTICALIGIPFPSGCTGKPLIQWMK